MRRKDRGRLIPIVSVILILTAGMAGCSLTIGGTQEKAQKIKKADAKVENKACESMSENPLQKAKDPELLKVVEDYYSSLAKTTQYIEAYEGIEAFVKKGLYRNTYVAFVSYGMKIRDIYTVVPGLSTLYVEKDRTSGEYQIRTEELDDRTKDYIETVAAHEDVRAVMEESRNDFKEAVKSDALLQEALADLREAYESSTGS